MRVLLDECLPESLRAEIPSHQVVTVWTCHSLLLHRSRAEGTLRQGVTYVTSSDDASFLLQITSKPCPGRNARFST